MKPPEKTDCEHCGAKATVQATYRLEGEWGLPYICCACLKDTDGKRYPSLPGSIMDLIMNGTLGG